MTNDNGTFRVGVDIGGTFTDTVMFADGQISSVKVPSTPPSFHLGLLNGLEKLGRPLAEMSLLAHGTTVGTNAIVSRNGARTAVVTTRGFRDLLVLRRGDRADQFNLWWQPQPGLVERRDRFEVPERIDYAGRVVEPLDEGAVRAIAAEIRRRGIEAVGVTFINSFTNPAHEQRTKEILEEELPDVYLSVSSDILPEILEYERTATTTLNAYIGPVVSRYVKELVEELDRRGYPGDVVISTSTGGVATPEIVRQVPARTVESGPAAGVMAAAEICRLAGIRNVVTFDMGGTSLDAGLIHEGEVRRSNQYMVEFGTPVRFPCVDVQSIGAGGGSIAWIDQGGSLRVGPQSAGASPGPACYDTGGTEPTVTDAEVVLGRLHPESFLGGAMTIRPELARAAIEEKVARHFGWDVERAAEAIVQLATNNMVQSMRLATVERGFDPRDFSIFAFGGAGPVFAAEVAREAHVPRVVVPRFPGLTSALGLLMIDIRHDVSRSVMLPESAATSETLGGAFRELEEGCLDLLAREGISPEATLIQRAADVRYFGQSQSITVPVPGGVLTDEAIGAVLSEFDLRHEREYGYLMPADVAGREIATLRVSGVGSVEKVELTPISGGVGPAEARKGSRPVRFEGEVHEAGVYDRAALAAGSELAGPAILEQVDSTIVVPPGATVRVDDYGNVTIDDLVRAGRP